MRIKVLGSAAGGGFPQWNCGCSNCSRLRAGTLKGQARSQTQVAISPYAGEWVLLNASPDLRHQLVENPEFVPVAGFRHTPISTIFLTSADLDCVLGLLHLREFQPLRVYATDSVQRALNEENSFLRALERSNPPVVWNTLRLGERFSVDGITPAAPRRELFCKAVSLSGKFPDFVSKRLRETLRDEEAVVGLAFSQNNKKCFFAPNLPGHGEDWKREISGSDLAMVDGTFWTDDELIGVRGSGPTAREMGHLPLSGLGGLLEELGGTQNVRRVLIHLNNTNPALDEESAPSRSLHDAGFEIAYDGMELEL